jgi:hypothetical protein
MRSTTQHQQVVAGGVPVEVVHGLEVVEVQQHERERVAGAQGVSELGLHAFLEAAAVERVGERIGPGDQHEAVAGAVVVLRLPCAQDCCGTQARCHERHVRDVGLAVEVRDQQEREHVREPHRHEDAQRIEDGREHHWQEEQERERTPCSSVGRDRDGDQHDVEQAPGGEEGVAERGASQDALSREQHHQPAAQKAEREQRDDQGAVRLIRCHRRVGNSCSTDRERQPDARLDHVLLKLALASVDYP